MNCERLIKLQPIKPHKKVKILIAEDETIVAKDIELALDKRGYEVVGIARTAKKAIALAKKKKPDLLLFDIMLRGNADGIDAAKQILERQDIPLIFLTAYTDDNTLACAQAVAPHAVIAKPFDENELYINIEIAHSKHTFKKMLQDSEERLYILFEYAPDAYYLNNLKGNFIDGNAAAEKLTGYHRSELIGNNFLKLNLLSPTQLQKPQYYWPRMPWRRQLDRMNLPYKEKMVHMSRSKSRHTL